MIPVDVNNAKAVAEELKRIQTEFVKPFDENEVRLKPQMVKNNRALAVHYVSARAVMDRLDDAVGIDGWSDEYTVLPSGDVHCRLSVKLCGQWVTKEDVGSQSEQPDEGDRMKAAFSDSLKRAAVKFGIGRYLYRIPQQWMDYDSVKKQILKPGNDALRAKYAVRLDQCKTREEYLAVCVEIGRDVKDEKLTEADRDALKPVARATSTKFSAPAKA